MRILISNDDGAHAPGLHALGQTLSQIADIYVAAPQEEQSGAGHGITVRRPLYVQQLELPFAKQAWAIGGLPADCVKLAMEELMPEKPQIMISGINDGGNVGNDIIYSGTVSAAREGFLYGLPAIAVSVTDSPGNIDLAAEFTRDTCLGWQSRDFQPRTLLNINVPGKQKADVKGWRYTNMGWLWYEDVFNEHTDDSGRHYYWMGGRPVKRHTSGNTDVETCLAGYISITPLHTDLTDYQALEQLRQES